MAYEYLFSLALRRSRSFWSSPQAHWKIGFVFGVGWASRVSQVVYFVIVVYCFEMFEIGFVFHFFLFGQGLATEAQRHRAKAQPKFEDEDDVLFMFNCGSLKGSRLKKTPPSRFR